MRALFQASHASSFLAYAVCSASAFGSCSASTQMRMAASYPSPGGRTRKALKSNKKAYNYLTSDRLIPIQRRKETRQVIRARDDTVLRKRIQYKEQLKKNVAEQIRYFSPDVSEAIFFPMFRNRSVRATFHGNRVLDPLKGAYLYMSVVQQLLSGSKRDALKQLIKGVPGVPAITPTEWADYTDPKSGDVNIGIVYSQWVRHYLHLYSRRCSMVYGGRRKRKSKEGQRAGTEEERAALYLERVAHMTPTLAYVILHFGDTRKVPSLAQWYEEQAEVRSSDLHVSRGVSLETSGMKKAKRRHDISTYGQQQVEAALLRMTTQDQHALMARAISERETLLPKLEAQYLCVSKVLIALNTLPEIRAIQRPANTFQIEQECLWTIRNKGSLVPLLGSKRALWGALTSEQQDDYFCFKCKNQFKTHTALQLYIRYCIRDYGLHRSEAARRFRKLSDLKQAALQFPFFYSISPKRGDKVAYKRFYKAMCERHGLSRAYNSVYGNRLFEAAMRNKWNAMSAEEQIAYDEADELQSVFPLARPVSLDARSPGIFRDGGGDGDGDSNEAEEAMKVEAALVGTERAEMDDDTVSTFVGSAGDAIQREEKEERGEEWVGDELEEEDGDDETDEAEEQEGDDDDIADDEKQQPSLSLAKTEKKSTQEEKEAEDNAATMFVHRGDSEIRLTETQMIEEEEREKVEEVDAVECSSVPEKSAAESRRKLVDDMVYEIYTI